MSPDDAPREHFSNLADPPWSIVAGGRVLGTGSTGTDAWRAVLATAEAERDALRARAEAAEAALAQAHADRTLMTGLWLATAPPDVLPALLPADPGDRDRLAAALDAVDLQASAGSHTAAGRSVIARIVAAAGGAR